MLEISLKCISGYDFQIGSKFIKFLFIIFLTKYVLIFKARNESLKMKIFLILFLHVHALKFKDENIFNFFLYLYARVIMRDLIGHALSLKVKPGFVP